MTASTSNQTTAAPRPEAKNWQELSSQFSVNSTELLSNWMAEQLAMLEKSQIRFVTKRSQLKSIR